MMCFSTTEDGCSYGRNVLKKHQDFNRVSSSQYLKDIMQYLFE